MLNDIVTAKKKLSTRLISDLTDDTLWIRELHFN